MGLGPEFVTSDGDEDGFDGDVDGEPVGEVDGDALPLLVLGVTEGVLTADESWLEETGVGVGVGVREREAEGATARLGTGGGVLRAAVLGMVTTPTMVGVTFGAGRTSMYSASTRTNAPPIKTVDTRARPQRALTGYPWGWRCRVRPAA